MIKNSLNNKDNLNNFVNEKCYYWMESMKKTIKLPDISNEQANLSVNQNNVLVYSVGGNVVFTIDKDGNFKIKKDGVVRNILVLIDSLMTIASQCQINTQLLSSDSVTLTVNGDLVVDGTVNGIDTTEIVLKDVDDKITNSNGFKSNGFDLLVPTLNSDATIATLTDIPGTGNFVTFDGTETITGLKTFSSSLKLSNGIINTNYSSLLMLPQTSGTLALSVTRRFRGFTLLQTGLTSQFPDAIENDIAVVMELGQEWKFNSGAWAYSGTPANNYFPTGIRAGLFATYLKLPDPHDGLVYNLIIQKDSNKKITNADGFEKNGFALSVPTLTADSNIVISDSNTKITNADGFEKDGFALSVPTLTANRTIATTADIPGTGNFVTTDSTSQVITGTKRFQFLNVGDSSYTDAQIGVFDSWGGRAFSFPKIFGRLMADTDGVTTNTIQNITSQKTFKSGLIVDSGGTLTIANSLRQMYSATNNSLDNLRSHYFPSSDGTLVNEKYASTTTPQTVGHSGATYGNSLNYARADHKHQFVTPTVKTCWNNSAHLNGVATGIIYEFGRLRFYTNYTTVKNNRAGSSTPFHICTAGDNSNPVNIPTSTPVFVQCETWYGEKGLYAYFNNFTYGQIYVYNNAGWTAGQKISIFAFWVDLS